MQYFARKENKKYAIFLILSALFSVALADYATSRYGAIVSGDSVIYLSVADNLVAGQGFFDHTNAPLIWFPPFYPLLLAFFKALTGADILLIGKNFQIFLLALNILLAGIILHNAFPKNPVYKYFGIIFLVTTKSFINQHIGIITEPLFITLTYFFIISAGIYGTENTQTGRALAMMTLTSALAFLTRWVGLALILLGGILILWKRRKSFSLFLREGFLFGFVSSLLLALWLIFHNFGMYNTLWGAAGMDSDPLLNIQLSLARILHWFLPLYPTENPFIANYPFQIFGIAFLALLLFNKKENWKNWLSIAQNPFVLASLLFGAIYFAALTFTIATYDHINILSTRYYPLLMLPVLTLLFTATEVLLLPHLKKIKNLPVLSALFLLLWMVYPLYSLQKYVQSAEKAEFSWESKSYQELNWNSRSYHESKVIAEMVKLAEENPNANFYTNYTDVVWLFTRGKVQMLPTMAVGTPEEEVLQKYARWGEENSGYILWGLPNAYKHIVSAETLAKITEMDLILQDDMGELYRLP